MDGITKMKAEQTLSENARSILLGKVFNYGSFIILRGVLSISLSLWDNRTLSETREEMNEQNPSRLPERRFVYFQIMKTQKKKLQNSFIGEWNAIQRSDSRGQKGHSSGCRRQKEAGAEKRMQKW